MTFDEELENQQGNSAEQIEMPQTEDLPVAEAAEPVAETEGPSAVEEEQTPAPDAWKPEVQHPEDATVYKAKGWTAGKVIALTLVCSLLASMLGAAGVIFYNQHGKAGNKTTTIYEGNREPINLEHIQVDTSKLLTPAQVYAANVQATVGIQTSITTNYWGYQTTAAAAGSGFVLTPDGFVATNYHVVDNANSIKVTMYDGTAYPAFLVGFDEEHDFAVLKIDAEGLQTVVLGDSSNLHVGDEVMTIGNPLGELTFSLTVGAVSALDRQITFSDGVTNDVFQTDCAINAGNSGGPMFNSYGEVIGVATGRYNGSGVDNICFAIPINIVMPVIEDLIEKGYTTKPYLGVTVTDVNPQMLKAGIPMGAAVYSVDENGGAVVAGIRPNDIITAVDDTVVEGRADLADALAACQVGQTVTLTVYRNGQTFITNAVLGEMIVAIEY